MICQLIPVILDALEVRHYFDVITSSDQVEKGKPAPDVYLKTAQRLNVEPEQCMVFEDSPSGLAAGVAADMKVIVVPQSEHYDNPTFESSQFKLNTLLDFTERHLAALAA